MSIQEKIFALSQRLHNLPGNKQKAFTALYNARLLAPINEQGAARHVERVEQFLKEHTAA